MTNHVTSNVPTQSVEYPLISLAIVTYNHEKYILDALKGAASQTYSPLEIIVSDDASSDQTASLINDFVREYKGPHAWRVNVNKSNKGILGNCSDVLLLAKGQLIVWSDGDDVSLPRRAEACYEHFQAHPEHDYFICKAEWMDEHGKQIPADFGHPVSRAGVIWNIHHRIPGAWGTCSCHHRRLYDFFGMMCTPRLRLIDAALAFRAVLLGGQVNFMEEKLVHYRQHAGGVVSASSGAAAGSLCRKYVAQSDDWVRLFQQMTLDVRTAHQKGVIDAGGCCQALRTLREEAYGQQMVAEALVAPLPLRALTFAVLLAKGIGASIKNACAIKSGFLYRR